MDSKLEGVHRVERRNAPSDYLTLMEDANVVVSRIVFLHNKISKLRRKHTHDCNSMSRNRTCTFQCAKCEGYGHEVHRCPNSEARPMTHKALKNYIICLKEVERSAIHKLEVLRKVRRVKKAQREREREKMRREHKEKNRKKMREKEKR